MLVACGERQAPQRTRTLSTGKPQPEAKFKGDRYPSSRARGREISRFRRGPYSDPSGSALGGGPVSTRTLVQGDAQLDAQVEALLAKTGSGSSKQACLDVLAQVAGISSAKVTGLFGRLLTHPDAEVRARTLVEMEGIADPAILPLVNTALSDSNPDVRLQALEVLERADTTIDPKAPLLQALSDADTNVRQLAFHVGLGKSALVRQELITAAASSRHPDLVIPALSVMESEPDKRNVPLFFNALSHPEPDVRELARETLSLTFHEVFESAAAGRAWWAANQNRFSQNLVEEILPPGEPTIGGGSP
jgi:hypothetical protein